MHGRGKDVGLDAVLLLVAVSARVLTAWLRGLGYPRLDLSEYFLPNFLWWWRAPRWLGGWNPWIFGGYPANADPQIGQLHPFGALYALLSPLVALSTELVVAPGVAAVGMLVYLRAIGCGRTPSLAGALSFGLGGFVAGHAPHPGMVRTAMAIPWALAAAEALDGVPLVVGFGAATGLLLLGGHPQVTAYAMALVLAHAAWLGHRASARRAAALAAGVTLGAGLAAGAWLPAVQLIGSSTRALGALDLQNPYRLAGSELMTLVVPFASGGAASPVYGRLPSPDEACGLIECNGYPGQLAWVAVLVGLPLLLRDRRGRFWLVVAVTGLVLAGVGSDLFLGPGVRVPGRFLLWWSTAMAVLAALALRDILRTAPRWASWWVAFGVVAAAIGWTSAQGPVAQRAALGSAAVFAVSGFAAALALRLGGAAARWGLVAALVVDLATFGTAMPLGVSAAEYRGLGRVLDGVRQIGPALPGGLAPTDRVLATPLLPGADWAPFVPLQTVQGYSPLVLASLASLLTGTPPAWYAEVGGVKDAALAAPRSHALDLLRCRVVVSILPPSLDPLGAAIETEARAGSTRWVSLQGSTRMRVHLNRRARPVAWLVRKTRLVSEDEALRLVRGTDAATPFDPSTEVLTSEEIPDLASAAAGEERRAGTAPGVSVLLYSEDEIRLGIDAPAAALLVTSELAYPGWVATIDGRQAPIRRVNAGFRAIVVPTGRHDVVLRYRPALARIGLIVSAVSLCALLVPAILVGRWRPGAPPAGGSAPYSHSMVAGGFDEMS